VIALTTMQMYVKRGIQGRAKDLTDAMIGSEQMGKLIKRDVWSLSKTKQRSDATSTVNGLLDGEFTAQTNQFDTIKSNSTSVDGSAVQGYKDVMPAEAGASIAPIQPPPTSEPPTS